MTQSRSHKKITVGGAPEGFDAQLLARLVRQREGPVLHIARDDKRLEETRKAVQFFAPDLPVFVFPAWDCLPYDRVSPNHDVSAARMATLATLAQGFTRPFLLLTTVNAATQRLPAREILANASFTATVGKQIDEAALREFLVRMGFNQSPTVMEPGDYAIRGGLIDLFPPGESGPVRLDLFGDVLDGARRFDPESQRTVEKLSRVELAPVSEVILDEEAIQRFRQNYRHEFGAAGTDDPLYEAVSAGRKHQGIEHWAPYFHERMETLFDYLPGAVVCLDDQLTPYRLERWDSIKDQYEARREALEAKARLDTVYKPCPPALLYLDDEAFQAALQPFETRQFVALPQGLGPNVIDAGGRIGRNFAPERQVENVSLFGALADHVNARRAEDQVILASYSEGSRERMSHLLRDEGVEGGQAVGTPINSFNDVPEGKGGLFLAVWALEHGFTAPGLTVLSEQDVLGDRLIRAPKRKRRAENFLTEATSISPGDLIVHVDHGVGRYNGLETITAAGAPHECIALEYAGGDRLFLPVENIELLSRYGHEEGLLDRLGGGAWQAKKSKLKERIRERAARLIRVAAERALRSAPIMQVPEH
ncbi:MAG: transcription-repair coupling factor, partial [Alphaproteobacteria bacterium]|nr:transcription-repair coupling factor [Alphaproteobacteria bacterium]